MSEIKIGVELSKWFHYDMSNVIKSLDDVVEIGQWCEKRLGEETIENGWCFGAGGFLGCYMYIKDEKIFTEFVLTWG